MIKRVATAVVLIPLVLVLVLKAPLYLLALVAGAVAVLAIAEFLKLVTPYGVQPLTLATYIFVALFFVFVIVASTNRTPLVVWAGDIFAYFVGKSLGRHHMSPHISPKKTWEGAAASIVASVIVGTLWIQNAPGISSALLRAGMIERTSGMW